MNTSFARNLRLRRLHHHHDHRLLVVPLDHAVSDGPVTGGRMVDALIGQFAANGADAIVVHKGMLRYVDARWFTRTSMIVHLSASTALAPDPDRKYLVAGVEEALRLGADAVSVHVNLGSEAEAGQLADLATVADSCDRWNVPLLAMMYARGPRIVDAHDPELVAHAAIVAADLGADIVKTVQVRDGEVMRQITDTCPIPIIVAGGPRKANTGELVDHVRHALSAGVAGVAMGRNLFQSPHPGALTRSLADVIHGDLVPGPTRIDLGTDPERRLQPANR